MDIGTGLPIDFSPSLNRFATRNLNTLCGTGTYGLSLDLNSMHRLTHAVVNNPVIFGVFCVQELKTSLRFFGFRVLGFQPYKIPSLVLTQCMPAWCRKDTPD